MVASPSRDRLVEPERPDPGAAQRRQVAGGAERGPEVAGQRPHVGARSCTRRRRPGRCRGTPSTVERRGAGSTSSRCTVTGRAASCDVLAGPHPGVRADAVDLDRRHRRRHLGDRPAQRGERGLERVVVEPRPGPGCALTSPSASSVTVPTPSRMVAAYVLSGQHQVAEQPGRPVDPDAAARRWPSGPGCRRGRPCGCRAAAGTAPTTWWDVEPAGLSTTTSPGGGRAGGRAGEPLSGLRSASSLSSSSSGACTGRRRRRRSRRARSPPTRASTSRARCSRSSIWRAFSGTASATKATVGVNFIPSCLPTWERMRPVADVSATAVPAASSGEPKTV